MARTGSTSLTSQCDQKAQEWQNNEPGHAGEKEGDRDGDADWPPFLWRDTEGIGSPGLSADGQPRPLTNPAIPKGTFDDIRSRDLVVPGLAALVRQSERAAEEERHRAGGERRKPDCGSPQPNLAAVHSNDCDPQKAVPDTRSRDRTKDEETGEHRRSHEDARGFTDQLSDVS